MANIKNDLVNELRNEKYYLDQDFVRLIQSQDLSYRDKLSQVNEVAGRIAEINNTLAVLDAYLPEQQESVAPAPAPAPEAQADVVTADAPADAPVAVEKEHKVEGQTHGE